MSKLVAGNWKMFGNKAMKADINVFNPEEVTELHPLLVIDFPGEAPRYIQKSKGF